MSDSERRARIRTESRIRRQDRRAQSTDDRRLRAADEPAFGRPLDGFEKTLVAAGVGLIVAVLRAGHQLQARQISDSRVRWTDKNRWE